MQRNGNGVMEKLQEKVFCKSVMSCLMDFADSVPYVENTFASFRMMHFLNEYALLLLVINLLVENKLLQHLPFLLWFAEYIEPSIARSRLHEGIILDIRWLHQGISLFRIPLCIIWMIQI